MEYCIVKADSIESGIRRIEKYDHHIILCNEDQYSNSAYIVSFNNLKEYAKCALVTIKNDDGLLPIVYMHKEFIVVCYENNIALISGNKFAVLWQHTVNSLFFMIYICDDYIITILETDIIIFNMIGTIIEHIYFDDIIIDYSCNQYDISVKLSDNIKHKYIMKEGKLYRKE